MNSKDARPAPKANSFRSDISTEQFKRIGMKPGNPDGSYFQEVPLAGIKSDPHMTLPVTGKPTRI